MLRRLRRTSISLGSGVTALGLALGLYDLSIGLPPARSLVAFIGAVLLFVLGVVLLGLGLWDAWKRRPLRELARTCKEIADALNDFDFERGISDPSYRAPRSWRLPANASEKRRQELHAEETDEMFRHSLTTMGLYRRRFEARALATVDRAVELGTRLPMIVSGLSIQRIP
jgi:hypothetical protein